MNKHYDRRLSDVLPEEEARWRYAPKMWRGQIVSQEEAETLRDEGERPEAVDVRTAAEMEASGFNVQCASGRGE